MGKESVCTAADRLGGICAVVEGCEECLVDLGDVLCASCYKMCVKRWFGDKEGGVYGVSGRLVWEGVVFGWWLDSMGQCWFSLMVSVERGGWVRVG